MTIKFAKIGLDGIVLDVVQVSPIDTADPESLEVNENIGVDFLSRKFGHAAWKMYDADIHPLEPYSLGTSWDTANQIFIQNNNEKPFDSWVINTTTGKWEAPVALPEDAAVEGGNDRNNGGVRYGWDEESGSWVVAEIQGYAAPPEE